MIEIKGKYNTAKVFTNNVEPEAMAQILELCNQEFVKDSVIRIMPDTHAGAEPWFVNLQFLGRLVDCWGQWLVLFH